MTLLSRSMSAFKFPNNTNQAGSSSSSSSSRAEAGPSRQPPRPFPFLRLPREIRDEIYSYLVLFDPQPLASTAKYFLPQFQQPLSTIRSAAPLVKLQRPRLDLAIFRVNRKIHEEAARMFYRENTFPIRIIIRRPGYSMKFPAKKGGFDVYYETLWDRVNFFYHPDQHVREFQEVQEFYLGRTFAPIHNPESELLPAAIYRPVLRKVHIDVIDTRTGDEDWREEPRSSVRTVLMPLVARLKPVLNPAGKRLNVKIRILTIMESYNPTDPNYGSYENTSAWGDVYNDIKRKKVKRPSEKNVKRLIAMAWPLTRGKWKYSLVTPLDLHLIFEKAIKAELEKCNKDVGTEEQEAEYKSAKLGEMCFWTREKGRLVVMSTAD
ncbi:hypothetical protein TWF173_010456 [Orbilia oligospora]|uniref:F-box domain-containing protein n=2 Tax=Orbilia oligospora TaxID=2813651 RepID=G1X0I0_ARTOA|nr:hypothetical protein AOL_s00006g381 [Orbilia oligospora ATCC 24927]EGX53515.1 hypothetical protein AOL_s00006g381 [Orbilia oligospora ATCC 24927]KAF3291365.1 hypothetical protein TWF970_000580 [Orbilia oligospora]KAF3317688.1 hypothetical protein TWF173_010456 [Orbilia oligospora]